MPTASNIICHSAASVNRFTYQEKIMHDYDFFTDLIASDIAHLTSDDTMYVYSLGKFYMPTASVKLENSINP
jgi:hypothetical protein